MAGVARPIFLYGPPGVGKSTVGHLLAEALASEFIDLDCQIEDQQATTIPEIFARGGESEFRQAESLALQSLDLNAAVVIALGGGALLLEANRKFALAHGDVLVLTAPLETLAARGGANDRPLSRDGTKLADLLTARTAHYAGFDNQLDTENLSPEETTLAAQQTLGRFHVRGMGSGYPVIIRSGLLKNIQGLLEFLPPGIPHTLVTDDNVAGLHARQLQARLASPDHPIGLITVPAGEASKNVQQLAQLWDAFSSLQLERKSRVLALGGGVPGDLAGFAAATYLRGLGWVNLPTTLLAMVDAGLGGKTGIDLPQGKNLVGAFHAPEAVLADPDVLATLPPAEVRNGLAELVKQAIIGDAPLLTQCLSGLSGLAGDWAQVISRAVAVKAAILNLDPYEQGARATLNFGHTIGHALEVLSGYTLQHGAAVAIGMAAECQLAVLAGITAVETCETLLTALNVLGLPCQLPPNVSAPELQAAMQMDKKRHAGQILFSLPIAIGDVRPGFTFPNLPTLLETLVSTQ